MNNNQRLRDYMEEYHLTYPDVARLCNVTVPTVDKWLQLETSADYLTMPDNSLDIFVKKIARGWVKQ